MSYFDPATSQSPVGAWTNYTPGLTNLTIGNGSISFRYRREGDSVRIRGVIYFGSTTSVTGNITFGLPAGLSIDTAKAPAGGYDRCGYATCYQGTGNKEIYAINSAPAGTFTIEGVRNDGTAGLFNATFPAAWANGHQLFVEDLLMPISGWSTNVNMTTDFQEFASNSSSSDGDDLTSFVLGPDGSQGIIGVTALTARCRKRVRYQNSIKPTDKFYLEVFDGVGWMDLGVGVNFDNGTCVSPFANAMFVGTTTTSGYSSGISIQQVNSTDVDVWFGRSCITITDQTGVVAWNHPGVLANQKWRLRKVSNGNFAENVFQGQISGWTPFTPVWAAATTQPALGNGTISGFWRRNGDSIDIRISLSPGSTTTFGTGNWSFSLPNGLKADSTKFVGDLGVATCVNGAWTQELVGYVQTLTTTTFSAIVADSWLSTSTPFAWSNGAVLYLKATIPIAEWGANINLATDFQEFLSCDGTAGVAANTNYTPTTVRDSNGSLFPSVTISGVTATTVTQYTLTTLQPIKATDSWEVEVNTGNGWIPLKNVGAASIALGLSINSGTPFGMACFPTGPNTLAVQFSNAGRALSSTWGTAAGTWAQVSTWRWRIRKISNGNFAQAASQSFGTSERLTDMVDSDSRPIYTKDVDMGSFPNATTKAVAHGIASLYRFTDVTGMMYLTADIKTGFKLPWVHPSITPSVTVWADATNVTVQTGSDRTAYSGFARLFYTKT